MKIEEVTGYLKEYDGRELRLMEVCGTHTASIFKSGIRSLISPKIKLIAGPGCPVCVTPAAYIDKCIEYAMKENHVLVTFGDMMKVPGTKGSLSQMKGEGAKVELMYSPMEVVSKAESNPHLTYIIAGVGFETTAPAFALTLEEAKAKNITNLKILTALRRVMPALEWICQNEEGIDGFICPGHVSVIIGSDAYGELAATYDRPFVVAGFEGEHILVGVYDILKQLETRDKGSFQVHNLYTNAVKPGGNQKAMDTIDRYFEPGHAVWRGLGSIEDSGLYLKPEFQAYEAGSRGLDEDIELPDACRCAEVIVGRINPNECSMFGKTCTPVDPFGPCMVSAEGACGIWYRNI